ncbi:MAG: hypothetical protein L3K19_08215 [Thermoplasmata archaeon]|nr:hypothetical protein [Thermoplasmata archaeon]
MYDPTAPMDPPPPPPAAPPMSANARYVFLLTRLRTKQITMEEATELFGIQQAMIRSANAAATAPRTPSLDTSADVPPPASTGVGPIALSDDLVWISLLGIGAGAGLLGAMVKRFQEGPRPPRSASSSSSGSATSR